MLRQLVDFAIPGMIQDGSFDRIARQWVNVQYKMSRPVAAAKMDQGI